jgi:CRISPR-associated protein Csb2
VGVERPELIRSYDAHREVEPRVHPARFVRYRQGGRDATATAPCSVFDNEMIVLARAGRGGNPRLPITSTVGVTRQLRRALMACADEPIHEALSGHQPDGTASETPHLAIIPLPSVAGPHPDGSILGFGLVMPRELAPTGRLAIMRALGRLENRSRRDEIDDDARIVLHLGATGDFELERVVWGTERATLRPSMWSHPSKRWASATPVALDRNPGDLHDADAEKRRAAFAEASAIVIEAVRRIGLPEPSEIDVVRSCVLPGSAKPRMFPRYPVDARRPQRVLVHVRLQFAEPVRGPILIGAGRYHGLGLLAPVDRAAEEMIDVHT